MHFQALCGRDPLIAKDTFLCIASPLYKSISQFDGGIDMDGDDSEGEEKYNSGNSHEYGSSFVPVRSGESARSAVSRHVKTIFQSTGAPRNSTFVACMHGLCIESLLQGRQQSSSQTSGTVQNDNVQTEDRLNALGIWVQPSCIGASSTSSLSFSSGICLLEQMALVCSRGRDIDVPSVKSRLPARRGKSAALALPVALPSEGLRSI
jgi:hypothetical protein